MRHVAGIDSGSAFTKAVIIRQRDSNRPPAVLGRAMVRTGVNMDTSARAALEAAVKDARLKPEDVSYVAATGFGRYGISFRDIQITEITSGARGAYYLHPEPSLLLDIGSQSTRAIAMKEAGKVRSFKTNDKCAAGSGSFIQRAAKYLQIEIEEVGELALNSENPQPISSVCAVLAESEIINHVSAGVNLEDIMRGIYDSLADRAALLLKRVEKHQRIGNRPDAPADNGTRNGADTGSCAEIGSRADTGTGDGANRGTETVADNAEKEMLFIGGVATQRGMVKALEDRLGIKVTVPLDCEYVCALGAALLGLKRLEARN